MKNLIGILILIIVILCAGKFALVKLIGFDSGMAIEMNFGIDMGNMLQCKEIYSSAGGLPTDGMVIELYKYRNIDSDFKGIATQKCSDLKDMENKLEEYMQIDSDMSPAMEDMIQKMRGSKDVRCASKTRDGNEIFFVELVDTNEIYVIQDIR